MLKWWSGMFECKCSRCLGMFAERWRRQLLTENTRSKGGELSCS